MSTVRAGLGGITFVIASEEHGFSTLVNIRYGMVNNLDGFPIILIIVISHGLDAVSNVEGTELPTIVRADRAGPDTHIGAADSLHIDGIAAGSAVWHLH